MLDLTTEVSLDNLPEEAAAAIVLASENIKKALEHLEEE